MKADGLALSPERMVSEYKSLVSYFATKYSRYGLSREDLEQEGYLGLLEAFNRFDREQNSGFATYASFWIKKYILKALDLESKNIGKNSEFNESLNWNHLNRITLTVHKNWICLPPCPLWNNRCSDSALSIINLYRKLPQNSVCPPKKSDKSKIKQCAD